MELKTLSFLAASCLSLTVSSNAVAAAYEPTPTPAPVVETYSPIAFFGGTLGYGGMDTPSDELDDYVFNASGAQPVSSSEDIRGWAGRVAAGVLQPINSHLAIGAELGYMAYVDNSYEADDGAGGGTYNIEVDYSGYAVDLLAILQWQPFSRWYINGKAGFAVVGQDVEVDATGTAVATYFPSATTISDDDTSHAVRPELGAELGFLITDHVSIAFVYQHIFGTEPDFDEVTDISSPMQPASDLNSVASVDLVGANINFYIG